MMYERRMGHMTAAAKEGSALVCILVVFLLLGSSIPRILAA